jgi:hypothetical protein
VTTHLLIQQTAKGSKTRCGLTVKRAEATLWYSEVDCVKCRPYRFMPVPADDPIGGMKMVCVDPERVEPPVVNTKVIPRRKRGA